jgi:hypothetical protein
MSSNLSSQVELKTLVARAAAKERRNLSLSILFTFIVLAIGFGWIGYSAYRVVKLKAQEADLKAAIEKAKVEVAEQEGLLRKLSSDIVNVKPALDRCAEGSGASSQDTKIAVAALSSAQQSVQVALNNPIQIEQKKEGPVPTPTPVMVVVPAATQMAFAAAEQRIRAVGLTARRVDEPAKTKPPGTVLYQDPLPGQRVAANSPVTLYVVPTTSAVSTEVPDLKGLTFEAAQRRIVQLGLTVRKVDQPGKGVPGTVLYQDPFAGRRVPPGSQVSIYVIP